MDNIRFATLTDLPRLVEIYNQAILAGSATADTNTLTVNDRLTWFHSHSAQFHPIYVCEWEEQIAGWLSISPYRNRPALNGTAEISYYVDYDFHRRGTGSALMTHALADAARLKKRIYLAILLEVNTASIFLLDKFGFEKWGYLPEVAEFNGKVCGQYYYGKRVWSA